MEVIKANAYAGKGGEYIDTVFQRLLAPGQFLHRLPRLPGVASQCAVCYSWPAQPVCQPCLTRFMPLPARCATCALALPVGLSTQQQTTQTDQPLCADCTRQRPPLDGALAAVAYAYPWSTLITRYKFGEQPGWAGFFAGMLLQTPGVPALLGNLTAQDWVLALPLSAERLQTRGFNQAWELASALGRLSGTRAKADAQLLLRLRDTPAQSRLTRQARLANVQGAFQVDPLRAPALLGRRVVLVDDVMTSGASLFAAAQALRDAGAVHITGLVLARTPHA